MSVVRTHPTDGKSSPEPPEPEDDRDSPAHSPARARAADDAADLATRTSLPPPMPANSVTSLAALNSRKNAASNNKQQRAKEAEEDRALIARAQAGDTGAFRQLVERHQRRAFAIALGLVRDENDARELVQDAFLRVFKSLGNFQGSSSFFTWLYRIITNLSIDLIRKPGRQTVDLDEARLESEDSHEIDLPFVSRFEGADPVELVRRREIGARLQTALDALPAYHRAVIVMREIEGLSYEEMAEAMGVSKGTIMSRLFHARQKLQRALADCYKEQVGVPAVGSKAEAAIGEEDARRAASADDGPESERPS
jgi:RNA polymerase sigma-70 factor (ECF subfamily)